MLLCALKCNDFYFYPSSLTTFPTSFGGRCPFTWNNVHKLALSFFYLQLLRLDASKYLTQCWNLCVLSWFLLLTWLLQQLVWLVGTVVKLLGFTDAYDWSLVVLLYWLWWVPWALSGTGMTSLLGCWSFQLVVVVIVCSVVFFCVLLLGAFLSFGGVRLLWLDVLVMWESNLLASQFACHVFYNVRVLVFTWFCRSCGS